jgi:hypothetical protein
MRRLLVVLVALIVVPTATAAFSVTLTSTSPQTFAGVTLNGVDQTKTLNLAVTVVNTNPSNTAGWSVTATAGVPTSGANTLSPLTITTVSAATCTGGGCNQPTNDVTWPQSLSTTAVKIFNAAVNTGQGTVVLTPTIQITYDAKALPGTYTATLTMAGVRSP